MEYEEDLLCATDSDGEHNSARDMFASPGSSLQAGSQPEPAPAVEERKSGCGVPTIVQHSRFESEVVTNEVPTNCLGVPCCMGIDEAGRGPVLGAMVYGAAYWPQSEDAELTKLGFNDSKQLTAAQREGLFEGLKKCGRIGYITISIPPEEISAKMMRRKPYNLNAISHDAAIRMVQTIIDKGVHIAKVFVDTVGDPGRYQDKLTRVFENRVEFKVAKKADSLYPVVSAASICAKVTRDAGISNWEFLEPGLKSTGRLGSGYPGDAVTKEWLKHNMDPVFGFPSLVRFSWSTSKKLIDEQAVPVEWEESDDEDAGQAITTFFNSSKRSAAKKRKRSPFVEALGLQVVDDI